MNRMKEYQEFMKELDHVPAELDGTLERAIKRKRRRSSVTRPLAGLAASFALFILLVNGSETIAQACSQIPVLRELAQAVTFSKSLSKAVENEYVQEMNLVQTDGDVTAEIEYLIVDRKSVVIFYELNSDVYETMCADMEAYSADGTEKLAIRSVSSYYTVNNGELAYRRMEFEGDVPDDIQLALHVLDGENNATKDYVAHFEFLLEFDLQFTSTGTIIELNKIVNLDGQEIIIKNIEIYPTQMCINLLQSENNTAWLRDIDFYIMTDEEQRFEAGIDGMKSVGTMDDNQYISCKAESIYFYNADEIKLVISGAKWKDKNQGRAYVNFKTGEYKGFPSNIRFDSIVTRTDGVELWVEVEQPKGMGLYLILDSYYDAEGNKYYFRERGGPAVDSQVEGDKEYSVQYGFMQEYSEDEVWVEFTYTEDWKAKEPIIVQIK